MKTCKFPIFECTLVCMYLISNAFAAPLKNKISENVENEVSINVFPMIFTRPQKFCLIMDQSLGVRGLNEC